MKIIAWLWNPWEKYKNNRHNAGFLFVDEFVKFEFWESLKYDNKFWAEIFKWKIWAEEIIFVKPMEFMNKSGFAIQRVKSFFKVEDEDILVIHDEIDLWVWVVKSKLWWGLAGHNWLKDIAEKIWTRDFFRIRLWVGRPERWDVSNYVLSDLKKDERAKIDEKFLEIKEMIIEFLEW